MDVEPLTVDPERRSFESMYLATGIYVRALKPEPARQHTQSWVSTDIAELDKASLLRWLRSRGGDNPWAENVVGILLGHGHLHETDNDS